MEDVPIPGRDDENALFKQFIAQFGEPAFVRRARRVKEAYEHLVYHCRHRRDELLAMVRLRIGILHARAGEWSALRPLLPEEGQIERLQQLHSELKPHLRVPVEPTTSVRKLRATLRELIDSMERFNHKWREYLPTIDLTHVNELREGYNRYYLLEKECALRSARLARLGFQKLEPVTHEEIAELLPVLVLPRLHGEKE